MPVLQNVVYKELPLGLWGEVANTMPYSVQAKIVNTNNVATPNYIGYAYTETGTNDQVKVGGIGAFAGIAVEPKSYNSNRALSSPALNTVPDFTELSLMKNLGAVIIWDSSAARTVRSGDKVAFITATGAIATYPAAGAVPAGGVQITGAIVDYGDYTSPGTGIIKMAGV